VAEKVRTYRNSRLNKYRVEDNGEGSSRDDDSRLAPDPETAGLNKGTIELVRE